MVKLLATKSKIFYGLLSLESLIHKTIGGNFRRKFYYNIKQKLTIILYVKIEKMLI